MEEFVVSKECKLSDFMREKYPTLGYSAAQKLIRKKEVKVNGKRAAEDCSLSAGDKITVYTASVYSKKIEIIFQDENVLVANKPAGIEVCDSENSLEKLLFLQYGYKVFAVHRLDLNTKGVILFAKTQNAKNILEKAFKNKQIAKFYLAEVFGSPKEKENFVAYLKKDSKKSLVYISDSPKVGYVKILTNYRLVEKRDITAVLEVEILTGKTHQIRAQLAHAGLPIVGDNKYGSKQQNRILHKSKQQLFAYKLVIKKLDGELSYLNGKVFEIECRI